MLNIISKTFNNTLKALIQTCPYSYWQNWLSSGVLSLYSEGNIIAGNEQQRGKGNLPYDPNT